MCKHAMYCKRKLHSRSLTCTNRSLKTIKYQENPKVLKKKHDKQEEPRAEIAMVELFPF